MTGGEGECGVALGRRGQGGGGCGETFSYDPNNYRGIAISSILGKWFNSIINTRLYNYLMTNKLINLSQIGFLKDTFNPCQFKQQCIKPNYV
jgi:hypothetical protein